MTREDAVALIAEKTGATKARSAMALDALIDAITDSVRTTGYAKIHRLCAIEVVDRAARSGRNPRTGEPVAIAARRVVTIRPLRALREAIKK